MRTAAHAIGLTLCLALLALHTAACGGDELIDEQEQPIASEGQPNALAQQPAVDEVTLEELMIPPVMDDTADGERTMSSCPGGLWREPCPTRSSGCCVCFYQGRCGQIRNYFSRWCHCENNRKVCGGCFYKYQSCQPC